VAEWTKEQIIARIRGEAQQQGVDPDLAVSIATQESYLNPNAKGDNGKSLGLFQLQPAAAIDVGVNPQFRHEPGVNIYGGVRYIKQKLQQSKGNVEEALRRYNGGGDPNYVQNVLRFFKPGVAEAAERPHAGSYTDTDVQHALKALQRPQEPAGGTYTNEDVQNALKALSGTQTSTDAPAPPTARSTPEQDAAYRASRGQQEPAPVSQTTPPPSTPPGGSQGPLTPESAWTPGMRFQALPSIQQLPPAERLQRTEAFARLTPALQEEFLRSEEPTVGGLAMGGGPVRQAPPVTDPAALLAVGGRATQRPPVPSPGATGPPPNLDVELQEQLTPAQEGLSLLLGGAAAGNLGRMAGGWAAGQLGRLAAALPLVGEGLANLGLRKGAVAAGMEEPGTAGDVAAVAAPAVLGAAGPLVAKVGNALRGVVKPAYQDVMDLANRYGIRLSYGDVAQSSVAPKVEAALEAIPGSGAGRFRTQQQVQVGKAGEQMRGGLQAEMGGTAWRDLPTVQRAAAGTGPRAKEAQALLAEIDNAGDDWGRVIQVSGKLNLFQDRLRAEKLYDQVETLAQPLGNMRLPKATQAIDDALARANADVLPSPEVKREVIGALTRIKGEISPTERINPSMGVRDTATGTLRAEAPTVTTTMPDTSYTRMRRLHSALGDLQREAAEPTTARYLSGVKTALNDDMAAFAQHSNVPALRKAHKEADTFYRTRIVPYREGQLAKAIERDLPDEIYPKFVRAGKDRATYFYQGLDPKGQAAVRYGMVQEAVEKATNGPHPDVFSPARFSGELRKIQDATGVFFQGAPQWEINGVTKLMQHAQRAGQYAENPPTGLRGSIGTAIAGTGAAVSLPAAVTALLTTNGLRTMFMTRPGRNFLLAASDMQPGSAGFQRALDRYLRTLSPAVAGVGAVRRASEAPQEAQAPQAR
jgi:hypothetical protein